MARQTIMLEGGPHDGQPTAPVSSRRDLVTIGYTTVYRRTERTDAFGRPIFEYVVPDDEPTEETRSSLAQSA